jgi:hypothetical protein
MDGRRLRAEYVVGRRHKDGPDVALQPDEMNDVIGKLLGVRPRFLSEDEMREEYSTPAPPVGRTRFRLPNWPRSVDIGSDLDPSGRDVTVGHELGHVLGGTSDFTAPNIMDELRALYNTINNSKRTPDGRDAAPGPAVTPETFGYRYWRAAHDEYVAEAYRAYMRDPNFVKTVAPNVAAAIRRAVNTNPRLNRVIQFNSLKFPSYAGLGASENSREETT